MKRKMKMRRTFVWAVLIAMALASAVMLSGCGGGRLSGTWVEQPGQWSVATFFDDQITHGLDGSQMTRGRVFRFSGNRFTEFVYRTYLDDGWPLSYGWERISNSVIRQTLEGTFSITGNQIELTRTEGSGYEGSPSRVEVVSFSRTDNTIEIYGRRFARQ